MSTTSSVGNIKTTSEEQEAIKNQMAVNSQAWHTADALTRADLENENRYLASKLGTCVSFDSKTGTWSGTANDDDEAEDYSNYINDIYDAKTADYLASLESAYDDNMAELAAEEEQIPEAYQAARNQAAGNSSQEKQNFAQYAAGNGLNSGAGGQAELARSVTLQGNLNSINQEEANALAGIELQRTKLTNDYNTAIASAKAGGDFELANALYQESVRADEALLNSSQLQKSWDNDDYSKKLQLAQYLAQYGDFSGFQALGIDTTKMEETYAKANG
ncbi:hypothetical protein SDC9_65954 [bioreactor metagenome]|uniref:Uncharacterized protein n=1 Tax=bioreactor metagenome TaxID=1076179 RepID=A0A644XUT2_9ZZZZ